ncbi:protein transport protein bet1 [Scheffersomyces spartinae]|uniref:Protein transport protein bet1 n=1 Tax=Scheffersomyces spartinae TaxID=45513 RepID=A0A9P7V9A5_9ASCO|nr:protein transport protein bet1 [Scheffersomyces spartinae]KAG7193415.1 protein transport protein bet1 [Scheffersomyces spartinae]
MTRTQLFGRPSLRQSTPPARVESPYDKPPPQLSAKHNEAYLLSLESQNNDEMDTMSQKVAALKNLGVKMGSEINKSIKMNDDITNRFEHGQLYLKNTYNRMVVMSQRAGITWRMWVLVFFIIFVCFFYVWIF